MDTSYFYGKTVLITGGLGFIGSNLAIRLADLNPKKIIIVDSLTQELGGNLENLKEIKDNKNIEIYAGGNQDIRNISFIKPLIKETDIIFNLAGSGKHTKLGEDELKFDLDTNLTSQVLFLEACRQVMLENPGKNLIIVFAGTRDQYGKVAREDLPVREDYLLTQSSDYQSITKNAAENYHMILSEFLREQGTGIKISSLRIANTYGPKQSTKTGAVIPIFIEKVLKEEVIELWGGGEALRDLNYIDDVIEAFLLVACSEKTSGNIYNLGCCIGKEGMENPIGGNLVTIKTLAEKIVNLAGKGGIKIVPYPRERKSIEPGHFAADISKIYSIGWIPKTSLEEGLKKTIEWYKDSFLHS